MVTFNITDGMHIRSNPWADTGYGTGEFYLASDPNGGVSQRQAQQREAFAEAAREASSQCSSKSGMAKNVCRARHMQNRL